MFEKCVDSDFALNLQEATIRAMGFMKDLSVCIKEDIDLDEIMKNRMAFIKKRLDSRLFNPN